MYSSSILNNLPEEQIELILIQQKHPINETEVSDGFIFSDETNEIIYSQFKIMQILQLYPDATILAEGNMCDVTASDRKENTTYKFRSIFSEYKNFNKMEFDNLTENQRIVLTKNFGVQALFHIGIIDYIYQTTDSKLDMIKMTADYRDSCRETLMSYPRLAVKALQNGSVSLKDLDTLEELEDYEKFKKTVRQKNPCMFHEREKEALDFSIIAAKKSGKKQVILIFGSAHVAGFIDLIETTYRNKVLLKGCIDSCEGFNNPDKRKELQIQYEAAIKHYKSGEYKSAINGFKTQVCFWQSTPKSTPHRSQSLLTAEFNLGSAFFKLAESDDAFSYEDAIPHLKNAVTISCESYNQPPKTTKYVDRYSEAVKRHSESRSPR
ncbi:MAG: hypothetical protein RJA83_399 [Pseudomonadota bacterium]|jgi:tetratricopeptide (TPR) repeat protein